MLDLPLYLPCFRIDRLQKSEIRFSLLRWKICAAIKSVACLIGLWSRAENVALVACRHVEQPSLRIVGRRHKICRTQSSRTNCVPFERGRSFVLRNRPSLGVFGVAPGGL